MLSPRRAELLQPEAKGEHCVRSHLKLSMMQRQWLMDAFVLAKALNRVLVLPPLWCLLDRFWTIVDHCLIGTQVEMCDLRDSNACGGGRATDATRVVGRVIGCVTGPRGGPRDWLRDGAAWWAA